MLVESKEFILKLNEKKVSTSVVHILANRVLVEKNMLVERMKETEGLVLLLCFQPENLHIAVGLYDLEKSMQDKENIFTDVFPVLKLVAH